MSNEMLTLIEYLSQNRSISRETLIRAMENAILSASRKSIHPASELKVKIDPVAGTIKAWAVLEVVDHIPQNSDQLVIDRAKERYPDVKVGDKLEIAMGSRTVAVEVLQVAENVRKDDAVTMDKEI